MRAMPKRAARAGRWLEATSILGWLLRRPRELRCCSIRQALQWAAVFKPVTARQRDICRAALLLLHCDAEAVATMGGYLASGLCTYSLVCEYLFIPIVPDPRPYQRCWAACGRSAW